MAMLKLSKTQIKMGAKMFDTYDTDLSGACNCLHNSVPEAAVLWQSRVLGQSRRMARAHPPYSHPCIDHTRSRSTVPAAFGTALSLALQRAVQ